MKIPILFSTTTLLASALWVYGTVTQPAVEPVSPKGVALIQLAKAVETPVEAADVKQTEKQQIMNYIVEKFGDQADKMITIIGTCENKPWDTHLIHTNNNGTHDVGISQVNVEAHRTTVSEMQDWHKNIDMAYQIYKNAGNFSPWTCSWTVGQRSFWEK